MSKVEFDTTVNVVLNDETVEVSFTPDEFKAVVEAAVLSFLGEAITDRAKSVIDVQDSMSKIDDEKSISEIDNQNSISEQAEIEVMLHDEYVILAELWCRGCKDTATFVDAGHRHYTACFGTQDEALDAAISNNCQVCRGYRFDIIPRKEYKKLKFSGGQ